MKGTKIAALHLKGCCRGKAFVEAASRSKHVARIVCTHIHFKYSIRFILFKRIISEIMDSYFF